MTVYVVEGKTESSDYYRYVFNKRPTQEYVTKFLAKQMPEEWEYMGEFGFRIYREEVLEVEEADASTDQESYESYP